MAKKASSSSKLTSTRVVRIAIDLGVLSAKGIKPSTVETGSWVRWKCQFGCGCFESSLVCPPHSPPPQQTRQMIDEYKRAVLFEAPRGQPKTIAVALERELFLSGYYKAFGMGAGPCRLCKQCAFDQGCRHPDDARPAMEACGIDVFATVRKHGFTIDVARNRRQKQHYFGMVLIE